MVFALDVRESMVGVAGAFMKLAIVIPAHNEENRIGATLDAYFAYFSEKEDISTTLIVVLNGCVDNTLAVVTERTSKGDLQIIDMPQAGKGLAIKRGFEQALLTDADLIGFVDADMATQPRYFDELIEQLGEYDGIIASRYMKESKTYPQRPPVKEWGRRLVYQPLVWMLFGLRYYDYQCGAKLFKRVVIEKVTSYLTVTQWAFDVELMYLCKLFGFSIKEWPTVWHDQADSKLKISSGFRMLSSLFGVRWQHSWLGKKYTGSAKE
jgi:glycosyltransferase involved in cell wall biosynthesis